MASPVQICNLALSAMGANRVTNINNPQTDLEELCQLWYPQSRRALMEAGDWSFAKRRVIMDTPDLTPPGWGYGFRHAIPSEIVRMISVDNKNFVNVETDFQWRVEDGFIVCDSDRIFVTFIYDREDTTGYSNEFVAALVARLKADMVIAVTENAKLFETFTVLAEKALGDAKTSDGMQGKSDMKYSGSLVNARQGLGTPVGRDS